MRFSIHHIIQKQNLNLKLHFNMTSHSITNRYSKTVLFVGCAYDPPRGGVAQVLYNYKKFIFNPFNIIIDSNSGSGLCKTFVFFTALLQLCLKLIFGKYKIVHIHTSSYNSFKRSSYWVRIAKLLKKKVVLHIHGGAFKAYYETKPGWISSILNKADHIICLTESWKEFYSQITHDVHISVVENVISPPEISIKDDEKSKLHALFLGLITETKGVFDLLEVISNNSTLLRGKFMLHIGGNGQIEKLLKIIKDNSIEDIVQYEGWVAGDRKNDLMNICDIFILPSYAEGLPVSIIEALSYGQYVIASNVGGIPEILPEQFGMLIEPGNKPDIKAAIDYVISHQEECVKDKIKRQSYTVHYGPKAISAKLRQVYDSLLK